MGKAILVSLAAMVLLIMWILRDAEKEWNREHGIDDDEYDDEMWPEDEYECQDADKDETEL